MTGNLNLDKIPPIVFKILRVFLNAFVSYCLFATVLYIMRNFDDVGEVAEAFALGLTALLSLTKMLTFYKSKQKFYDFMKRSEDMTDEYEKSGHAQKFEGIMRLVDLLSSIYLTSALITAFVHCAKPLIENFWTLLLLTWESFHYNRTLPLKAAFLYDPTISGVYELSFIGICLATYNSALMSVALDSIFLGSCLNLAVHCDILRGSFDGDKKKFVEKHLEILNHAGTLNDLYKPIVFMQLLTTNILLCAIGFQVVMLKNVYTLVLFAPFGLASVLQLLFYCYGSQIVMDKISSAGENLYDLDKELVIIIARTQKEFKIKSLLYQADLPTFTAILGSAQGLITMLKSFT